MQVTGDYEVSVDESSALVEVSKGGFLAAAKQFVTLLQNEERFIELTSDDEDPRIDLFSDNASVRISKDCIVLSIGESVIRMTDEMIQVNNKVFPANGGNA